MEKEMFIQQLNKALKDQYNLLHQNPQKMDDHIKEEYDILLQRLDSTLRLVNNLLLENQALNDKFNHSKNSRLLQEQSDKLLYSLEQSKDNEIQKLSDECDNLKLVWRNSLNEQSFLTDINEKYRKYLVNMERALDAFKEANPSFAIKQIKDFGNPQFIYNCNTIQQKKQLLSLATQTQVPDVMQTVIWFIKASTPTAQFDYLLFEFPTAVSSFLNFLEEIGDRKEWERIMLATNRKEDYAFYLFNNALKQEQAVEKLSGLQRCLRFIKEHSCRSQDTELIEEYIVQFTIDASNLLEDNDN
uniref:Uncharacterized protein n=1 Tax=Arcella intermedia TaxID=1963864 RepID=A0A6B2LAL5_9EUKA